jgi:pyruvate/2-oxoglutarate/acetoin dehydrogenase E1 component
MKYVEFINSAIKAKISQEKSIVLFGQNINAGSCLSGLTRNLKVQEGNLIINSPNCENSLCGIGFGLMISGINSIYFMKQQDFLLLGIDHLVNTYNVIRRTEPNASFTIMAIVVDSGYEGPQSCLNSFADFCSIARVPGFTITNKVDAEQILNAELVSPGFRLLGVSQRLFKTEIIEPAVVFVNQDNSIFQYSKGKDVTIVCFNFSLPYGIELKEKLKQMRLESSLFSVNALTPVNWDKIIEDLGHTKKLLVIDDCKSIHCSRDTFLMHVYETCNLKRKIIIKRDLSEDLVAPGPDQLEIDYDEVVKQLTII